MLYINTVYIIVYIYYKIIFINYTKLQINLQQSDVIGINVEIFLPKYATWAYVTSKFSPIVC